MSPRCLRQVVQSPLRHPRIDAPRAVPAQRGAPAMQTVCSVVFPGESGKNFLEIGVIHLGFFSVLVLRAIGAHRILPLRQITMSIPRFRHPYRPSGGIAELYPEGRFRSYTFRKAIL